MPALRAIRAAVPDHRLVLATTAPLEPLAGLIDAVDEVLPARELEPLDWTGPPPELAVDLHGKGPASHVIVDQLHPDRLLTFDGPGYPGPGLVRPTSTRCGAGAGWSPRGSALPPTPTPSTSRCPAVARPARDVAVVHPGAAFPGRRWPPERFAAVARHLAAAGHESWITGGPAEVTLARAVAAAAGLGEDAVLAGADDVRSSSPPWSRRARRRGVRRHRRRAPGDRVPPSVGRAVRAGVAGAVGAARPAAARRPLAR